MATTAEPSVATDGLNYINGAWVASRSGRTISRENPADMRQIVGSFQDSTVDDVAAACAAAAGAFPAWAGLAAPSRGEYLRKAADILETHVEEVARILTLEMGKTIGEARGETRRGVAILRYYAAEGMREIGLTIPSADASTLQYTTRVPLGPVALITPWNFPVAIPLWKMAPALIYGNTVVLKPASLATVTATVVVRCLAEAGFPPGVINLVGGSGGRIGTALATSPHIHGISFTGSNEVGRGLAAHALERGTKYQLEMGGKNAVIVCDDAAMDQAVELTISGAMRSTGQKCTATSRAIVLKSALREFTDRVVARSEALKVGPGLDASVYLGPSVSASQRQSVLSYIDAGKHEGARLLTGGAAPAMAGLDHGYFVQPTVFDGASPDMKIAQEEIFGPVLAIIEARDIDHAVTLANGVAYGLSASIFTRDINRALQFINRVDAGMVRVNGETAGVELQAPFGGMKASSSHSREQGRAAIEFFTSTKTIAISPAV